MGIAIVGVGMFALRGSALSLWPKPFGTSLFSTVIIEPGHRWYMVIGDDNDAAPLQLIDKVDIIRSQKDRVLYRTDAFSDFGDSIATGPHWDWRFRGALLYRDGEIFAGKMVATEGRFSFGPLAKQGFSVITCRISGNSDTIRATLLSPEASLLYPKGSVSTPERSAWQFSFFIKPKDQSRVAGWPNLQCR